MLKRRRGLPNSTSQLNCSIDRSKRKATDIEAAKAMLANPDIGVAQIAHRLGVSPATLYRYIPAARTANTPDV
jgi:AcrR family transcriptional regulator